MDDTSNILKWHSLNEINLILTLASFCLRMVSCHSSPAYRCGMTEEGFEGVWEEVGHRDAPAFKDSYNILMFGLGSNNIITYAWNI